MCTMYKLSWIISCLIVLRVAAQDSADSYTSMNSPAYYQNEKGTFTCSFSETGEALRFLSGFGLRREISEDNLEVIVECTVSRKPDQVDVSPRASEIDIITAEKCQTAYNDLVNTGSATLSFERALTDTGKYHCSTWTSDGYNDNTAVIDVASLSVAPTMLTMTIKPETVYEGDTVDISCTSEGGVPAAQFEYAVDDEILGEAVPSFKAKKEHNDRKYTCRDKNHQYYMGGANEVTQQEQQLAVYYFSAPEPLLHNMPVNPSRSKELRCSVDMKLPADNDVVSYSWTKDGELIDGEVDETLVISQADNLNETVIELYSCQAKPNEIPNLEAITRSFNISWDVETSTPTTTTTTTKAMKTTKMYKKPSTDALTQDDGATMIIIGVVVAVTVIILIIVIVIIIVKKRGTGNQSITKDAGSLPQKKGDPETGNGEPEATDPMLNDSQRGETTTGEHGN